jgi:hypothetical protein
MGAQVASALGYVRENRRAQKDESITFTTSDGKELSGIADKDGNVKVGDYTYTKVHQNERGAWTTSEKENEPIVEPEKPKGSGLLSGLPASKLSKKADVEKLQKGLNELLEDGEITGDALSEDGIYGKKTKAAVKKL